MVLSCARATRSTTLTASLFASIVRFLLSLVVSRGTCFRPDADVVRPLQQAQKVLLPQMHRLAGQPSELRRGNMRGREARRLREDALATGMIAGVTALTAIGSRISSDYDSAWFRALRKPRWEPSGAVIGPVWAVLGLCTALSASLIWWLRGPHDTHTLMGLFAL